MKRHGQASTERLQMDYTSPLPIKRARLSDNLGTHMESSEPLKKTKVVRMKQSVANSNDPMPFARNMKFVPNNDMNISNTLQRLKLKTPDGRDLGEIKVKLFPKKQESIGSKTIVLKKHSLFNKFETSSAVSILKPVDQTSPMLVNLPCFEQSSQSAGTVTKNGNKCVSFSTVRTIRPIAESEPPTRVLNVSQQINPEQVSTAVKNPNPSMYSAPALCRPKVFVLNAPKQNQVHSMNILNGRARNFTPIRPKPQSKLVSNNNQSLIEGQNTNLSNTDTVLHTIKLSKDVTGAKSVSLTNQLKSNTGNQKSDALTSAKLVELTSNTTHRKGRTTVYEIPDQCITLKKGKLYNNGQSMSVHPKRSIYKSIAPNTTTLPDKSPIGSRSWTIIKTYGKKSPNSTKGNDNSEELPTSNTESPTSSQTKSAVRMVARPNSESMPNSSKTEQNTTGLSRFGLTSVLQGKTGSNNDVQEFDENSDSDQNYPKYTKAVSLENIDYSRNRKKGSTKAGSTYDEATNMEIDNDTRNVGIPARDSKLSHSDSCIRQNDMDSTAATNLQEIDIIQKALSTLTDQDLREKALKALEQCGIGIKRNVPIPPTKSVCDSVSQTTVFSLLKPDNLVEYDVNFPNPTTLKVVDGNEASVRQFNNGNCAPLPNFENTVFGSSSLPYVSQIDFDDILLKDLLSEPPAPKVAAIKDILSKPNPTIAPILDLLKQDYEAATTSDHNGRMGIHRAVVSGDMKEVQRQLIVLKALKESIDVQTDDGMTSLELAVSHEVDSSIVRLLLREGAKPSFEMKLHESALIIASRLSSDVLPDLISSIYQPHLLNLVDIEGFAPLHYCTQEGNFNGVKLLISAGADVNLRDSKSGRAPLFHALEQGQIEIAFYLLDNGASPSITNFAGQSPAALVDEFRNNLLSERMNRAAR